MARRNCIAACVFVLVSVGASSRAEGAETVASGPVTERFSSDWKFFKGDAPGAEASAFDDRSWRTLDLPHDWSIEGPFHGPTHGGPRYGFLPLGVGWYRKSFRIPDPADNRKVFIRFDGVYKNSDVWLNGQHLGKRFYGYVSFHYDLTPHLRAGAENVLAVRVDNAVRSCRWYSGSGIYRDVWLETTNRLHIDHWGVSVTTPTVSTEAAEVRVAVSVRNESEQARESTVRATLTDPSGAELARLESSGSLAAGHDEVVQTVKIPRPILWSAESPTLYQARIDVLDAGGKIVDTHETTFGIREVRWDKDKGLFVNGQSTVLKGVCLHHDLGALGAAYNDRAMERRLRILKSMGCNAIRASHNPPAAELLDLCDRLGFYVIDEAFDKWGGSNYPTFEEDWEKDLRSMLLRDRNHPSVILWSVGNEVGQQKTPAVGAKILKMLVDFVHREEPSRKVTSGLHPEHYAPEMAAIVDVVSLNYSEPRYERYRRAVPGAAIVGSEAFLYYRGTKDEVLGFDPVNPWFDVGKHDYVVGSFLWAGIDYLGEAVAGWPCHAWNGTPIDACGFRRPISYLHESFWSEKPVVHIAVIDDRLDVPAPTKAHWGWPKMVSHWTLPALSGKKTTVGVFTNCEQVELFVNDRSHGVKARADFIPEKNGIITWDVPYEAGRVRAVGTRDGKSVAQHELRTAGAASRLELTVDRDEIQADGRDVAHVEVRVVDANGVLVPSAYHTVGFEIEGPGRVIAVDNGDVWSLEPYQGLGRKAHQGRCLAIVQSNGSAGKVEISAMAGGLASGRITFKTRGKP
jgi:beta-galactosidase